MKSMHPTILALLCICFALFPSSCENPPEEKKQEAQIEKKSEEYATGGKMGRATKAPRPKEIQFLGLKIGDPMSEFLANEEIEKGKILEAAPAATTGPEDGNASMMKQTPLIVTFPTDTAPKFGGLPILSLTIQSKFHGETLEFCIGEMQMVLSIPEGEDPTSLNTTITALLTSSGGKGPVPTEPSGWAWDGLGKHKANMVLTNTKDTITIRLYTDSFN